jgi:polysaccharide biosynthesis transport protein
MNDKLASLSRDRTTPRAIFIRVAVTVFLLTMILATAVTYILPESFASTCKVKLNDEVNDRPTVYSSSEVQTTFEIINSRLVLSNVIAALNLNVDWGKKYFAGETLKTTETMEILKGRMALAPVRNTKLISITVYSDDKNEAAQIANTVAESYKDYRNEVRTQYAKSGLKALTTQYLQESNLIQTLQSELKLLGEKLSVPTNDAASFDEFAKPWTTALIEDERAYKNQFAVMQALKGLRETNAVMLREVLPQVIRKNYPTNSDFSMLDLAARLRTAQLKLAALTNIYPETNPQILETRSLIGVLNHEFDSAVDGTLAGLETIMLSKKASANLLAEQMQELKKTSQPYWDKKQDLGKLLRSHEMLNAKIGSVVIDSKIAHTQLVQIIDPASPARSPIKPNKTLNIAMGAVYGIFLGLLAGAAVALVATRRGNRAPIHVTPI